MTKEELDYELTKLMHGDEKAFETVYNETKHGLFSFIYSICKDYSLSEDIMQETYVRIRNSINTYKPGINALAWIFTIAKNLTLNEIKKHSREVNLELDDPVLQSDDEYGEEEGELVHLVNTILTDDERQIVNLHLMSGFKHREIAEMMGKPLGTVLWAYRNALKKLKTAYDKEHGNR